MNFKLYFFFLMVFFLSSSCSVPEETKYQDTTELEIPPTMVIVKKQTELEETKEDAKNQGLGNNVILAGTELIPVIKIKKLFDRSWNLVEQALKLNDIEVKDKNRELGVFYVLFSPDDVNSEQSHSITSFLFSSAAKKSGYKLLVSWKVNNTEVTAGLVSEVDDDLLDDDEDIEDFEVTADNGATLINVLFKTLKHDLQIN